MLIFNSGKIVFTGAKTREQLLEAFRLIEPVLRKFKRAPPAALTVTNTRTRRVGGRMSASKLDKLSADSSSSSPS